VIRKPGTRGHVPPVVGHRARRAGATRISPGTGSSAGTSESSVSSGPTGGYSAIKTPAPACRNRPGPISCGTPWSKAGHHPMTPPWPGTGRNAARRSNPPLDSYTVRLLSRAGRAVQPMRGKPADPRPAPQSPRAGNTGSCGLPRRRSRRTTWSTTTRPAPHAATGHTSYTPPATGRNIRPGWRETPCCSRRPEPPKRLAWAACRDEWHARS
jgi:hypothetical protein